MRSPRTEFSGRAQSWGAVPGVEKIQSLSLFLGNKCNLHCATCDAKYSTGWIKIAEQFGVNQSSATQFDLSRLDDLVPALSDLRELSIMGGEPVYMNELDAVIDRLSSIDLKNCTLRISTNGTLKPTTAQLQRWEKFGTVNVVFSIDGVGLGFEYLRNPGKWDELNNNIEYYSNLPINTKLSMFATVSTANAYDIDKLAVWGITNFGLNVNFNPAKKAIWEVSNLPDPLKQAWLDKYSNVAYAQFLKPFVLQDAHDVNAWQNFRKFCNQWDRTWELDFSKAFPEWTSIIKKHNLW
jgi:hypothetical protein